jgi:hypothetical protein
MNITDIDDKILARSLSEGVPVRALTLRHERSFARSLADLNVWPPDVVLRVSEHMDAIVSHVERLVESGAAYVLDGEGVYFDVGGLTGRGITKYGKLGMGHLVDKQGGGKLEGANEAIFQWSQQQQPPPQLEDIDGEAPTRQPARGRRRQRKEASDHEQLRTNRRLVGSLLLLRRLDSTPRRRADGGCCAEMRGSRH